MAKPNWLLFVAFVFCSICLSAPAIPEVNFEPNFYAVREATISDGIIVIRIAGDKNVGCNVRNVSIRVREELKGTFVHLTDEVLTRGTTTRLEIYVRTTELSHEWHKVITDYLEEYELPSDIVPHR